MSVTPDAPPDSRRELPWPDEPDAPAAGPPPVPTANGAASTAPSGPPAKPAPRPALPEARIGRLHRADPAELWRAGAFATWLAENLDEVGKVLGGKLSTGSTDPATPGAVAATDSSGAPVRLVVELGASSDETFGILVRQLVSSGTRTIIWVCGQARDEHLTSVTWLNREISGRLHVVTVEAVQIDDSVAAPIFRLALRAGETPEPAKQAS